MMYSQQEYDMVRRQTLQIEAEKRSFLRTLLTVVSAVLILALILIAFLFRRYSQSSSLIGAAEEKASAADAQYQRCNQELQEKRSALEAQARKVTQRSEQIGLLVPKVINKSASETEIATLANAIYESPGHSIELPSIPPGKILRRYRYRSGDQVYSYLLVAGAFDGKWVLFSNLMAKGRPK